MKRVEEFLRLLSKANVKHCQFSLLMTEQPFNEAELGVV